MNRISVLHTVVLAFAAMLALAGTDTARAEAEVGYRLRAVQADQPAPLVVRAGETFALEFSGVWRDSCVPHMLGLEGEGHRRVLSLRPLSPGQACARVLTPFELRLEGLRFPAGFAGVVEIALITDDKEWLSTFDLVVQSADVDAPSYSAFDVQGAWYSPSHSGSGLTLLHSRAGEADSLVGMWMNFDGRGASRWYMLAETLWVTPTRAEGVVYRLSGRPFACTAQFPNPDCDLAAVPSEDISAIGEFEIDFGEDDDGRARLQFSQPDADGRPVLAMPIELHRLR